MRRTWYLYLLECRNGRLYSGITTDLAARFDKHQRGTGAMFTRLNPPRRIVAATVFDSRSEASKAEYRMKQLSAARKLEVAATWNRRWCCLRSSDGDSEADIGSRSSAYTG